MYYYEKITKKKIDDAEMSIRMSLKNKGFGILTEIDGQKVLKEKLGIDMKPYKILGACNPKFAHNAIKNEPQIGVQLPCNILLRETNGEVTITTILPTVQLGQAGNKKICEIAEKVEELLKEAVDEAAEL